jgi:hypothetical protein
MRTWLNKLDLYRNYAKEYVTVKSEGVALNFETVRMQCYGRMFRPSNTRLEVGVSHCGLVDVGEENPSVRPKHQHRRFNFERQHFTNNKAEVCHFPIRAI